MIADALVFIAGVILGGISVIVLLAGPAVDAAIRGAREDKR